MGSTDTKKVILITGASAGIGKDAARQLINDGHIVYGAARRMAQMQDLVKAGGHALKMDVTDDAQIVRGVAHILKEQGRIDVLVNNAGHGLYGAVEDISMEEARRQFEVNIFGLARITQEVLPHMRGQNAGRIINISSVGGKIYTLLGAWYFATKHALEGWSDCLRLELKPFNIDVVIIEPGIIKTEFGNRACELLLKVSGQGSYAKLAHMLVYIIKKSPEKKKTSSLPAVITRVIVKAIQANKPKTRYAVGKFVKPLLWLRKHISDQLFDKIIMRQFKRMSVGADH